LENQDVDMDQKVSSLVEPEEMDETTKLNIWV